MFRKILIANRGEIAVRIARACREMSIRSVAVYSDADRGALHVRVADEAYPIGPAPARESYLVVEKILGAAKHAGCDALHPGYGFLAENPHLSRACKEAGIIFVGPSAEAMERLGAKTEARRLARESGVPTLPGTFDPIEKIEAAAETARRVGFPVVFKAVAGGGGKGMRTVERGSELASAWRDASSEALSAFGDGRLYIEKCLVRAHHVEIQVLADAHGHCVHLGERECSVQRRYQKVIEESPSPLMTPKLRGAMGEAAVKVTRAGGYRNAGTCEFLVDAERNFYFLEMNTRLQVEHPVTEMVTSFDLVKLQMRIAAGEPLPFRQEDIVLRGHAIECRIYAEDPENQFLPSPGKILSQRLPSGPGIRVDEGVYEGWTVTSDYDPLLSKLIAQGSGRAEAMARLDRALGEFSVRGIKTNAAFLRRILAEPEFVRGEIHTTWLDELLQRPAGAPVGDATQDGAEDAAVIAAALWHRAQESSSVSAKLSTAVSQSNWRREARREQLKRNPRRP